MKPGSTRGAMLGGRRTSDLSRPGTPAMGMKTPESRLPRYNWRRNLIIFDWDDTLCPTHWIREQVLSHMNDSTEFLTKEGNDQERTELWQELPGWFRNPLPEEPDYEEPVQQLCGLVTEVLEKAASLGKVAIVTNGISGWVDKSTSRWLAPLRALISRLRIEVLYARDFPVQNAPPDEWFRGSSPEELQMSRVEWTFTEMKAQAMGKLIREGRNWQHLVSIGDCHFEMPALQSSARRYHRRRARKRSFSCSAMESIELDERGDNLFSRHGFGAMERPGMRCFHQTVKMRTLPTVQQMIEQLTAIRDSLGALVHTSADGDLNTEEDPQTFKESVLQNRARNRVRARSV